MGYSNIDPFVDAKVRTLTRELEDTKAAVLVLASEIKFLKNEIQILRQEREKRNQK